ncbi:hypothetical protein ADIMK_4185 [Marinobacterium lacunae]|uniref:DUF4139 domain-containing protein n=1 Tax=Marinobacterium lacunae TaxID=1232683 RepID=A0A081FT73_9GAMM|nr:DUF4139 domain-containing protein [Marinobacterium lacunae]KEA61728.1 hypothetical protein ADIMK_4185 [Marinobacterium lacunae]MBR9884415.1 DUF4139 domain-containing protein [Oceanospirillales bacterium]
MLIRTLAAGTALLVSGQSFAADPLHLANDELTQRRLMIFQSGQTLFSEQYALPQGFNAPLIEIEGISPQLQPGSALVNGAGAIEHIALLTPKNGLQERLKAVVGQTITLKRYGADGQAIYREARLLEISNGQLLVEDGDNVEHLALNGDWKPLLPKPVRHEPDSPYLQIKRDGQTEKALTLSYMGGGINWQADYSLTLDANDTTLSLQAQATLANHSGIDLPQSQIRLLAGQVNQPQGSPRLYMAKAAMEMAADSMPSEEAFEDYHLYTLPGLTDLPAGTTTSVPLMPTQTLDYSNSYHFQMPVYGNAQPETIQGRPQRVIRFNLPQSAERDTPLPAGNARVYTSDPQQGLSFIGGQYIAAHAAGEQVEMVLGEAFDIGIEQTQSLYERQGNTTRTGYQVTLSNAGKTAKSIELTANFNQNWKITQSSAPAKTQGAQAAWTIQVPAGGKTTLSYQVELTRR